MNTGKYLICSCSLCLKSVMAGLMIMLSSYTDSFCQEEASPQDTVKIRHHSPRTAILLSALLPGMGQVYNGKIWKVPIIYAAEGTSLYTYNYYQLRYNKVLQYLRNDSIDNMSQYDVYGRPVSGTNLARARDFYRKYRDYSLLWFAGFYVLNIIDALVDAHLFEYDISDDLSLNIQPIYYNPEMKSGGPGLQLVFTF